MITFPYQVGPHKPLLGDISFYLEAENNKNNYTKKVIFICGRTFHMHAPFPRKEVASLNLYFLLLSK